MRKCLPPRIEGSHFWANIGRLPEGIGGRSLNLQAILVRQSIEETGRYRMPFRPISQELIAASTRHLLACQFSTVNNRRVAIFINLS